MRKQTVIISFIIIMFFFIFGCSKDEKAGKDLAQKKESEAPGRTELSNTYPLTGEKTNQVVDNRAIAVMINNHPKARPQTGLSQADLVFEILAEGNITRLMALFQSEQPEEVGPVRSARPYYFNTADDYGALYVYHGAADFIEAMLVGGAADYLNGAHYDNDGYLFKRANFRVAPHNSYLQFDSVYEVAEEKGYDITADHEALLFLEEEEISNVGGTTATEVSFKYNTTPLRYVYNKETEQYQRYNGQSQTVELNTEQSIQLDNVFILETNHEIVDDAGRREIDLASGGNAYLLQKGTVQKIQWENRDGRIIPVREGEPIGLVPGKTWINVIPKNPGLDGVTIIE
ncbi:DUF3048 domain-containing protein [Paraliobacillus sp. JSM ZJ581]|uniref:DUF3048 domain-containing protein n=1 Tax=Paraliobacillus sp. JSM ZJ581 TaxID=3342118 RepID=UPI0035A89092